MVANNAHQYTRYMPSFPKLSWGNLEEQPITERALSADAQKKALLSAAEQVIHLSPAIGTELVGVNLSRLTDQQKDELALLIAQRGVVFFRNQKLDIHEQLDLLRYFGPLHRHPSAPIPRESGLEEVTIIYSNGHEQKASMISTPMDLWHSEVSYELQPPSITCLKLLTCPDFGGDTLWSSSCALYSSLSRGLQTYLEGLQAVHSWTSNAQRLQTPVRREPVETIHPVVRVHPATGWKSIFVNPYFTTRIIGISKAESDSILNFLYRQMSVTPEFQVRFRWEANSVALWDNRVVTHSAIHNSEETIRHGLRVMAHGERPISIDQYLKSTGKTSKDRSDDKGNWGLDTVKTSLLI